MYRRLKNLRKQFEEDYDPKITYIHFVLLHFPKEKSPLKIQSPRYTFPLTNIYNFFLHFLPKQRNRTATFYTPQSEASDQTPTHYLPFPILMDVYFLKSPKISLIKQNEVRRGVDVRGGNGPVISGG